MRIILNFNYTYVRRSVSNFYFKNMLDIPAVTSEFPQCHLYNCDLLPFWHLCLGRQGTSLYSSPFFFGAITSGVMNCVDAILIIPLDIMSSIRFRISGLYASVIAKFFTLGGFLIAFWFRACIPLLFRLWVWKQPQIPPLDFLSLVSLHSPMSLTCRWSEKPELFVKIVVFGFPNSGRSLFCFEGLSMRYILL